MRNYNGWGMDAAIVDELPDDTRIDIFDSENNKHYITSAKVFKAEGFKKDHGHGEQYFLNVKYFESEEQTKLF